MRLVLDAAQAKRRKNLKWLREFKGAGIPVKTGRTASTMVHNKWGSCWFANTIVLAGQVLRLTLVCNW
jgi:predicted metal-dependent hydrolase